MTKLRQTSHGADYILATCVFAWRPVYTSTCPPDRRRDDRVDCITGLREWDIERLHFVMLWALAPLMDYDGIGNSLAARSGTHYRTVAVTRCSAATVSDNCWTRRRTYFGVTTEYTQRSRDASWLCATYYIYLWLTLARWCADKGKWADLIMLISNY